MGVLSAILAIILGIVAGVVCGVIGMIILAIYKKEAIIRALGGVSIDTISEGVTDEVIDYVNNHTEIQALRDDVNNLNASVQNIITSLNSSEA